MSACGKVRYRSRVDALIALARISGKGDQLREKTPRRAYRCGTCKGWHLTSMAPAPPVTDTEAGRDA